MPGFRGRQLHEVQILVETVERVGVYFGGPRAGFRILQHDQLELVHLLEEFLRGLHRRQVFGSLRLIDPKRVPEEVHGRLHVVVPRVEDGGRFAIPVLFGAYPVDVFLLPLDDDRFGDVEKVLNCDVEVRKSHHV